MAQAFRPRFQFHDPGKSLTRDDPGKSLTRDDPGKSLTRDDPGGTGEWQQRLARVIRHTRRKGAPCELLGRGEIGPLHFVLLPSDGARRALESLDQNGDAQIERWRDRVATSPENLARRQLIALVQRSPQLVESAGVGRNPELAGG
jgi:hypothetical protein